MNCKSLTLMCVLCAAIVPASLTNGNPLERETAFGVVLGYSDDASQVWVWKGIPFAKPPIGELRWRRPENPDAWSGVRMATEPGEKCVQLEKQSNGTQQADVVGREDCLYLDIYRPQSGETNLPVYVWIHGGANTSGSAQPYDLGRLARKANLVAVVIQYRLSVFGFFSHPSLRGPLRQAESSGNFGLLDQIQALQWIRGNIAYFGGNPHNVTVAGESAGGHNIMGLVISPLANGLFHRAIMQSGGMVSMSVENMDEIANRTIQAALVQRSLAPDSVEARHVRMGMSKTDIREFLRGLEADELLRAHIVQKGYVPLGNLIEDGHVIPGGLLETIESGRFAKVPIILGANHSEATLTMLFAPTFRRVTDVIDGTTTFAEVFSSRDMEDSWRANRYHRSRFWRAIMVDEVARRLREFNDSVYVYEFWWGEEDVLPEPFDFLYGATHGLEIPFFHADVADKAGLLERYGRLLGRAVDRTFTPDNGPGREAIGDAMVAYLAQFVRTGNPNGGDSSLPEWKPWSNHLGGPKAVVLNADLQDAKIAMSEDEVSVARARIELDAQSESVRNAVWLPPYARYERGDYQYGPKK